MLFDGWEVCTVKTCDRGLENVRTRAAFFFSLQSRYKII